MKAGVSHGFFRCAKDFHFLGANIGDSFSEPVTDKLAKEILRISQKLVPVRTGALRATGRVVMTRQAISKYRRGKEVRYGDSRVRYANVVEFGRMSFAPFAPRLYLTRANQQVMMKNKKIAKKDLKKVIRKGIKRRY
tara:strand:+ start:2235 stop:2645 length:411 start_codon:yes stop_codon:yes gene_type:complete